MEKKSSHFIYILECKDGTYYTGYTTDVEKRINVHNLGKGAKYTRCRIPVKLRYQEKFPTKQAAMQAEYRIKQLSRAKKEDYMKRDDFDATTEEL